MQDTSLFKRIKRIEIVSRHLVQNLLAGDYLSTFHGQGLEFSEVREYQPGDEVRFMDWNVTARMQQPYVKVFQEERELVVLLLVDISHSSHFGTRGSSKRELAAELAATLGFAAAHNGDRVGMILFSDQVEAAVPAKPGRTHVLRLVRDLLAQRTLGKGSALGPAIKRLPSLARRKAIVFLISDFLMPGVSEAMRAAALRYDLVACQVADPSEQSLPAGLGLVPVRDPESGQQVWLDTDSSGVRRAWEQSQRRRQESLHKGFRKIACDTFLVRTGEDFVGPLISFFKRRERRQVH